MKNILILLLLITGKMAFAQGDICKALENAVPSPESYGKYKLVQLPECTDGYVTLYYIDASATEQVFSIILTDTKHPSNKGMLADAESKYKMASLSNDKGSLTVSRFKLGNRSLVAHDVNTGAKRIYGYKTILKNRYVLDVMMNNSAVKDLAQFQDFIADYLSKVNESVLPN